MLVIVQSIYVSMYTYLICISNVFQRHLCTSLYMYMHMCACVRVFVCVCMCTNIYIFVRFVKILFYVYLRSAFANAGVNLHDEQLALSHR